MKYLSVNSKLNFPDFSVTLKNCYNNCEYGHKSRLCYASNNPRIMVYIKKKLENNEKLLNSKSFVSVLKKEILLSNSRKIRFFTAGDISKITHLEKIDKLCRELPKIIFWLSTHTDHFLFNMYQDSKPPQNLNIILSNKIPNTKPPQFLKKWLNDRNMSISYTTKEKSLSNCHSSIKKESCGSCENCFEQKKDIIYYLHGKFALKRLEKYEAEKIV